MGAVTPGFVAVAGLQAAVVLTVVGALLRDHLQKRRRRQRLVDEGPNDE
ncbi:MAG: hypothetical protein ABEJ43_08335 [Haloferacaceae archaeon]